MVKRTLTAMVLVLAVFAGSASADDQSDARILLDKAMQAMNGEAKLAKLATASGKAKLTFTEGGMDFTVEGEGLWQGMSQYRADMAIRFGGRNDAGTLVLNRDKGWFKKADKAEPAPEEFVPFLQNIFYAARLAHSLPALRGKDFKLMPLGETKIGAQTGVGLAISHMDRKDMSLFFDKDTGLPLKSEIRLEMPRENKEITAEFHYGDYKDFDGVQLAAKITIKLDGKEFTLEFSELKGAKKVDDGQFGEP